MSIWDKGVSGSPQKRQLGREDPLAADVGRWAESHLSTRRGLPTPLWGAEQSKHTLLPVNTVQRTPRHKGASLLEGALITPSRDMAHGVSVIIYTVPRYSYGVLSAPTVKPVLHFPTPRTA